MRDTVSEKRLLKTWSQLLLPALTVATLAAGLSGCATTPDETTTAEAEIRPEVEQQLGAVRQMAESGEFGNASLQLQQLDVSSLSPAARAEWHLLMAESQIGATNIEAAAYQLQQFEMLQNYASQQQEYRATLISAQILEADGEFLAAARERDFISAVLEGEQQAENYNQLWDDLQRLAPEELQQRAENAPDTRFGAWLTLAAISRDHQLTLDEQLAGVKEWQFMNPDHPASFQLPGALALLEDMAASRPQRVALLLPLSGALASSGKAIRDGFMAAYYETLGKGYPAPAVTIIDASNMESVDQAYAQAIQSGSQWLVGPLDKQDVQKLEERATLPLPTLALNYGSKQATPFSTLPAELFQFGLAAEDEAIQIAEKAWLDGHRRALVMIPQGSWGERIYAAFEARWLELGGEIEETLQYPRRAQDYNPAISRLLNVDSSKNRYRSVRGLMREPVEFEPRRRQDADWLFMVALPEQARQIKPTLAFNFAGDLPVYATSHVFSGEVDVRKDRDLNGIYFCDVPWLLHDTSLKAEVDDVTGGQGGFTRLYAMGADAFRLVARVKQLEAFPESRIYGNTGALTLDNARRIHRSTDCTRFRSGKPIKLSETRSPETTDD